jgi:ribose transport system ATP-binding protein
MVSVNPVVEVRRLAKSFGGTAALTGIDLDIFPREVLGIVGENGAGKTTLLNLLSGIVAPDAGTMRLHGRAYRPKNHAEAVRGGISRVFQEQALIPNIRVYENLLLSHEALFTAGRQWIRSRRMIEVADEIMKEAGIAIDVRQVTAALSFSKRQLVEIVRACLVPRRLLKIETPVVLLDEPTASLEKADEQAFFSLIEKLREDSALVLISHRLGEVLSLSERIAVMKDGELVRITPPEDTDENGLHALMVGRERAADYYREARQRDLVGDPAPAFSLRGLTEPAAYESIDIDIRPGEVLGVGGLLASGKSALGKGAAGILPAQRGEIRIRGEQASGQSIASLIGKGLGYVPAERLAEGMIATFPVSWNISLAGGADTFSSPLGIWNTEKECVAAQSAIERLGIKADGPHALCSTLSGGNQQKVVIARWLGRDLSVLILDNPTRGIDAGAKEDIYSIIRDLADRGMAILLISDELLELIGLSNRIAIMQHGRITAVIDAPPASKPTEQQLIQLMLTSAASPASKVSDELDHAAGMPLS